MYGFNLKCFYQFVISFVKLQDSDYKCFTINHCSDLFSLDSSRESEFTGFTYLIYLWFDDSSHNRDVLKDEFLLMVIGLCLLVFFLDLLFLIFFCVWVNESNRQIHVPTCRYLRKLVRADYLFE